MDAGEGSSITGFVWSAMQLGFWTIVGTGTLLGALLYRYQENLLYFPTVGDLPKTPAENPPAYRHPGEYNIAYDDFYVDTADGERLHSWLMLQENSHDKVRVPPKRGRRGRRGRRGGSAVVVSAP